MEFIEVVYYNEIDNTQVYRKDNNVCVLIDNFSYDQEGIFNYSFYCEIQNRYMYLSEKLYRFNLSNDKTIDEKLNYYLNNTIVNFSMPKRQSSYSKIHIDNTPLEHLFEEIFIDTFGAKYIDTLSKEVEFTSSKSASYFADYVLISKKNKYIFEENGVLYHHPKIIGEDKYSNQLEKQNDFTLFGFKTFRFSTDNLLFREQISDFLLMYLDKPNEFIHSSIYKNKRGVTLYDHQVNTLDSLDKDRLNNKNTALIVLPTATGKSEIILSDLEKDYIKNTVSNVLILVSTNAIKDDWIYRLREFDYNVKVDLYNNEFKIKNTLSREYYDYIVIDEAHHAQASNLKSTIQYYKPKYLIGLTATPDRLDDKKLEEIFSEYEESLSLEEAIKQKVICDIAPFRLKSNIDLSEVRFNGKDYNYADLERNLIVDSRNYLIKDCILEYFKPTDVYYKQGIIFCVNINHAKKMASILNESGIIADALYGGNKDNDIIYNRYLNKEIQFLCSCNLISEGWDCPQTEVIVMARPTLSKVLYLQQVGRGLRLYPNKKCLWLIDVVDNYSAKLTPWNYNKLFKLGNYTPFTGINNQYSDYLNIEGLHEYLLKMEQIDIFSLEDKLKDLLSLEQAARELFIGTNTLSKWNKTNNYSSEYITIGNKIVPYFSNDDINKIREDKKLKLHTSDTILDDFKDFIDENNLTFSFKLIFIKNCLLLANSNGEINLTDLVNNYREFYLNRLTHNLAVDKPNCVYTSDYLNDYAKIKKNLLDNPFEKFERKRFLYLANDLNIIAFNPNLWMKLDKDMISLFIKQVDGFIIDYYNKYGGTMDD